MAVRTVALDEFDPANDGIEPSDQTRFNVFEFSLVLVVTCPIPAQTNPTIIGIDEFDPINDGYVSSDLLRLNVLEYAMFPARVCDNLGTFIIDASPQTPDTTLQEVLDEIADALVEPHAVANAQGNPATEIPSGLWTYLELIQYLEERRASFLAATEAVYRRVALVTIPQIQRHQLPADWIATRRAMFQIERNDRVHLHQVDEWSMDQGLPTWQQDLGTPRPRYWMDVQIPRGLIQTAPASNTVGQLELLMVTKGEVAVETLPGTFGIPNELLPPIKWGVLAMALGKVGRGHDPDRAAYAEMRYREGIEATRMLLDGLEP